MDIPRSWTGRIGTPSAARSWIPNSRVARPELSKGVVYVIVPEHLHGFYTRAATTWNWGMLHLIPEISTATIVEQLFR